YRNDVGAAITTVHDVCGTARVVKQQDVPESSTKPDLTCCETRSSAGSTSRRKPPVSWAGWFDATTRAASSTTYSRAWFVESASLRNAASGVCETRSAPLNTRRPYCVSKGTAKAT